MLDSEMLKKSAIKKIRDTIGGLTALLGPKILLQNKIKWILKDWAIPILRALTHPNSLRLCVLSHGPDPVGIFSVFRENFLVGFF
jgi:hypothetical protein